MVDNVLYFSTQNDNVVALETETGREIWKYNAGLNSRENRGFAYWPGDRTTPARILFGTGDGRLIALDAKTGKPADGFGDNGVVNLRTGVTDKFPRAVYGISAPPAVYRNIVIVGAGTQEGPSLGPSGDARAFDARTGKLLWAFHTVPRPGEPGNETWGPDGWKDRSGPSQWGAATIDVERGLVFPCRRAIRRTAFMERIAKAQISMQTAYWRWTQPPVSCAGITRWFIMTSGITI